MVGGNDDGVDGGDGEGDGNNDDHSSNWCSYKLALLSTDGVSQPMEDYLYW